MKEKPDRSNYEIWLIDWIDGRLDQSGIDQMKGFLDENPDLKDEAELFSDSKLRPSEGTYLSKNKLKKDAGQLTVSQIEYLSAACVENDITPEQRQELEENLAKNPDNRKIFEDINKIRLAPDKLIEFKGKKGLFKRSPVLLTIRSYQAWLSAAAAIAILFTLYFLIPGKPEQETSKTALVPVGEPSVNREVADTIKTKNSAPLPVPVQDIPKFEKREPKNVLVAQSVEEPVSEIPEPVRNIAEVPSVISVSGPVLVEKGYMNTLIASAEIPQYQLSVDDGRSRLEKFFARNFREVILKEEIPTDAPLKRYEFAEAGIEGLNMLLGWDMTLVKNNDAEGEVQSLSFNSRLLKFNAPVKNEETGVTF